MSTIPICAPFYGESGPAYTRTFRPSFIANLWGDTDEAGWSLAEHLLEQDEGSATNPIVGAAAYQAKARRLFNTRSKKTFTALRKIKMPKSMQWSISMPVRQATWLSTSFARIPTSKCRLPSPGARGGHMCTRVLGDWEWSRPGRGGAVCDA